MDDFGLLHSHSRLSLQQEPEVIEEVTLPDACEHNGVQYDPESMSGIWEGRVRTVLYEWEIADSGSDYYVLHQRVSVSSEFARFRAAFVLLWLVVWALLYQLQRVGTVDLSTIGILPLGLAAGVLLLFGLYTTYRSFQSVDLHRYPDPLVDVRSSGFQFRQYRATAVFTLLEYSNVAWLAVAIFVGVPELTLVLGAAYVTVVLSLLAIWAVDGGELFVLAMERSPLGDLQISGLARRYVEYALQMAGLIALVPALSLAYRGFVAPAVRVDSTTLASELERAPLSVPLFDELLMILVALVGLSAVRRVRDEDMAIEYFDFQSRRTTHLGRIVDAGAVLLAAGVLYIALASAVEVLLRLDVARSPEFPVALPLTLTVAAVLPLYFPAGIVYQHRQRSRRLHDLLENSSPTTVSVDGFEADVHVLETDTHYATSFETRSGEYIVVSKSIVEDFEDEVVAAVVAHEAGHIANGDTRLCNRVVVVSTLLLVGQNVLYDMVNFYEREHDADRHAAQQVGLGAIRSALTQLRDSDKTGAAPESFGANFAPQFDPDTEGEFGGIFELFFGGFALSDAHPSIDDRLERLPEQTSAQSASDGSSDAGP
ncbi:M48 family metalloprotease [Haloarcula sediminis]|uniref:M48 family metalloprotease n=1 Tax=Haloarcula sediminis TaxID=3111777 RepID=UPI002D79204D|nr:M48 family metalloprotease [Haloarcula sp. CK38]